MAKPNVDPSEFDKIMDELEDQEHQAGLEEWIAGKESTFEDRLVCHVVTKLGLAPSLPQLKRDYSEMLGEKNALLTFNWFHENWPSFPLRLCSTSWAKAHEVTVQDLFKRFTNTLIYKKYMDIRETIPDNELYGTWGMIFPWHGFGRAIIHNNPNFDVLGTRIVRELQPSGSNRKIVYLDILDPFLEAVRARWSP